MLYVTEEGECKSKFQTKIQNSGGAFFFFFFLVPVRQKTTHLIAVTIRGISQFLPKAEIDAHSNVCLSKVDVMIQKKFQLPLEPRSV
jgi:hypothetical protein